jgi:hypothetical protein
VTWRLSRVVVACQARRLRRALRAAPAAVVPAVAVLGATIVALYRAGAAGAGEIGTAMADPAAATVLVLALATTAAGLGAVLAAALPSRDAFGAFVSASPAGGRPALVAGSLLPAAAVAAPAAMAFALALAPGLSRSPGGSRATAALGATLLAAVLVGVAVAECVLQASRLRWGAGLGAIALSLLWLASGRGGDVPALGPGAHAGSALSGTGGATAPMLAASVVGACAVGVWLVVAPGRPAPPSRFRRLPVVPLRRCRAARVAGLAAVLVRRRDLVRAAVTSALVGVAGVLVARLSDLPSAVALQLGIAAAALGAGVVPLAAPGALLEGRALWWLAPRRASVVCSPPAVGAVVVAGAMAPSLAVAAMGGGGSTTPVAQTAFASALTAATAVCAGSLVPLRRTRAADQAVSLCAFGACAGAVAAVLGHLGGLADESGVSHQTVALASVTILTAAAALSVHVRLGSG